MKLLVRNDFIIGQCKDDIDIPIPDGAVVYFCPDHTNLGISKSKVAPIPKFSQLGITKEKSDLYYAQVELKKTDREMIRVIDDIINILIENNINIDSLPREVRERLSKRDSLRKILK